MELKEMTVEQLEERMAAIPAELDNEEADLDALEAEERRNRGMNAIMGAFEVEDEATA